MLLRTVFISLALAIPAAAQAQGGPGAVYTLTNEASDNAVAVALRSPHGDLLPIASYSTGGTGTGAGLGSQGALAAAGRWVVAVNAGSDDITLFRTVFDVFLWRYDVAPTGGVRPTSVAIRGDLVYALNADTDDISGFRIRHGRLAPVGTFPLSQSGAAGAQVGFDPAGRHVVVTERATNRILTYRVRGDGTLGTPVVNDSVGQTPFGFTFRGDGTLIVSEAAGGAPNASVVSSYEVDADGHLRTITAAAPTDQSAACWIAIPRGGRFAYSTNTASGSLTGFAVGARGGLTRLDASGRTGDLGASARPIDFAFDRSGQFAFVLDSGGDEIVALRRHRDGTLSTLPGAWAVPDGAAGLLVR